MTVRSITQKLNDIAQAARADAFAVENRRIARLGSQIENLAMTALAARLGLSNRDCRRISAHAHRDEILASAVIGDWNQADDLVNTVLVEEELARLADPLTGHVVTLNEPQTHADGLTRKESAEAFAKVEQEFNLRVAARTKLSTSPFYSSILRAADAGSWVECERLLGQAGIIE